MIYFSEAPLIVKKGLLQYLKVIVDYHLDDAQADKLAEIEEQQPLFACELQEFSIFKKINSSSVRNLKF